MRLAGLLLLCAGAARAECPVPADLEAGGIRVADAVQSETLVRHAPGVIASTYRGEFGEEQFVLLANGLYQTEIAVITGGAPDPASRGVTAWDLPGDWPDPAAGGTWVAEVTVTSGEDSWTETRSYSFGAARERTFGDCTLPVIEVEVTVNGPDLDPADPWREFILYFPGLGVSVLAGHSGAGTDAVRLPYDRIEAVR